MISAQHIKKTFGKLQVLDDISLEIHQAGIVAILGPNGSGKTTFLKILLGMVIPDAGEMYYQNQNISKSHLYRKFIGYLPQIARFPDNLTVSEIIGMIADVRNEPSDPERLVQLFGVGKFLDKKLGNLSGGTRQKVNIVLTFMFDTPVIVLDEPTAGLDPVALIKLKELIYQEKAKGKIILITSHIMSLVEELADEVVFLLEGSIYFQGTITELKSKTATEDLEHAIATILEP
ncbi:ABC transporter ATP-binding protein [Algoriphagus halophilus]|uniref:Cu-processing system ATP-binding protein n=1 Tax=Algoriphagus halophilus TaxID=226505 RepID=A0A1N6EFU9_9BACT|nr:ABC transporter ATP-binding protein [Algoriphagus halophilus]SIN81903.1 Cu-processing system ATP-binding protein [Algoriphagus halophilus]